MGFGQVDSIGGDLGRGNVSYSLSELETVFRVCADIFPHLPKLDEGQLWKMAVEVDRTVGEAMVFDLYGRFDQKVDLYVVDGRCLFNMRGATGGILETRIFYITQKRD